MSRRTERFCDFKLDEDQAKKLGVNTGDTCTNKAEGRCFFCRRDFCRAHEGHALTLRVEYGHYGHQIWEAHLPVCIICAEKRTNTFKLSPVAIDKLEGAWRQIRFDLRKTRKEKKNRLAKKKEVAGGGQKDSGIQG